ncbi:hypothetical protein [Nocardia lasii]|uniref:Uncharacterized protein n=1 Tax=Nocardia lasii TaxID=1616107 RepID=A0ABW1JPU0_9NOCA
MADQRDRRGCPGVAAPPTPQNDLTATRRYSERLTARENFAALSPLHNRQRRALQARINELVIDHRKLTQSRDEARRTARCAATTATELTAEAQQSATEDAQRRDAHADEVTAQADRAHHATVTALRVEITAEITDHDHEQQRRSHLTPQQRTLEARAREALTESTDAEPDAEFPVALDADPGHQADFGL